MNDTSRTTGAATTATAGVAGNIQATFADPVTVTAVTVGGGTLTPFGSVQAALNGRSLEWFDADAGAWAVAVPLISGVTDTGPSTYVRFPIAPPLTSRGWRLHSDAGLAVATTAFAFELSAGFECTPSRPCQGAGDCRSGQFCTGGRCAQCTSSAQCGPNGGACLPGGGCGPCTSDGQCSADGGAGFCDAGVCQ